MAASIGHTYSPSCMLHQASNEFTRRASVASTDPPKISAQYFYCSSLPIDDPLSPVPPPSSNPANKSSKVPPRPFSVHDSIALEDAWLRLQQPVRSKKDAPGSRFNTTNVSPKNQEHIAQIIRDAHEKQVLEPGKTNSQGFEALEAMPDNRNDMIHRAIGNATHPAGLGKEHRRASPDLTLCDDPEHIPFDETMPVSSEEIGNDEFESGIVKKRKSWSPFRRRDKFEKPKGTDDAVPSEALSPGIKDAGEVNLSSSLSGRDTSGTPFLRIPSRIRGSRSRRRSRSPESPLSAPEPPPSTPELGQADGARSPENYHPKTSSPLRPTFQKASSSHSSDDEEGSRLDTGSRKHSLRPKQPRIQVPEEAHVAVGMLRLHVVHMPSLKMGPIYWDPVHDVSSVIRGTWFFKDTMMPIESDLANRIEEGYEYIRPWTQAYVEELDSCMEVGPEAELKIIHKLWPDAPLADQVRPTRGKSSRSLIEPATTELGPEEQKLQQAIVFAEMSENKATGVLDGFTSSHTELADASIIYANGKDAQILRTSQIPSVSRGRKPLGNIRKGKAVGIPVVRGFDMKAWEKLHPPTKKAAAIVQAQKVAQEIKKAGTISPVEPTSCIACASADERPKPTDLVLVIHGIGQKLSERVESFHFTHNINRFRRQMNLELEADPVKPWLRQDLGSIMVLPINWRSKMNLDEGGPEPNPNQKEADSPKNQFALKDITADSLPAVRNLISDVMLDIPYYLSHHRPKMIEAVIHEANRVYRLWCSNNPDFHENGRVHLIAHSLGSVMCLDILSKQPTRLPRQLDLKASKARTDIFEFDTKGLFFCGSPAGFFLLLNKAPLIPRKGRDKPGTEGEDSNGNVAGEASTYGCLAVDNLYNVMHYLDPVAYRLNACVDVDYAAALKPASVPSATESWGQYLGSVFRSKSTVPTRNMTGLDTMPRRPTVANMPSTVELEIHNFTQEEIAEKRMFLLNDNGQIDYTLRSSGGALEIQYLNMLSAHSSYWTMRDFVRFLVVEIGRKPGKSETINSLKAAKKAFGTK